VERLANSLGSIAEPWGYVVLAAIALLEAAAFVGLAVPGETALLLAGFLASEGKFDLHWTIIAAVGGAIIGDSIGYELGRHLGEHIRDSRLGAWVGRERWDKGRSYLRRHGGRAVFFGRFIGFLRAIVPAVAGDARLPYGRFLVWNASGAIVWGTGTVLAGYFAGSSYHKVEKYFSGAGFILLGLIVVLGGALWFVRRRRLRREGLADERTRGQNG
jgi:membrane-associated protein